MHTKKSLAIIIASSLLLSLAMPTASFAKSKKEKDTLAGTAFTISIDAFGISFGGGIAFHEGGTFTGMDDLSLGRPIQPGTAGSYGTVWNGRWKKICSNRYRLIQSNQISSRDTKTRFNCDGTPSTQTCCSQGDLYLNGIPNFRLVFEAVIELSADCNSFTTIEGALRLYNPTDLNVNPPTEFVDAGPACFTGQKIKFTKLPLYPCNEAK